MGGVFFVKKWTFPQRRVHYVGAYSISIFILHFTYLGGAYAPDAPPPPLPTVHFLCCYEIQHTAS